MRKVLFVTMAATGFALLGCGPSMGNTTTGIGGGGGGAGTTGTGGSGASCNQNATCGGNIVGTWAIAQLCNVVLTPGQGGFCAEHQISVPAFQETGTLTFAADGTATSNIHATGTIKEVLPLTCLMAPLSCEAIDASVKEQIADPDSIYTSGGCSSIAGNCDCTFSFDVTSTSSQTYTTSGSTLTQTRDGTSANASYCVQGSTLIISWPSTTGGPPGIYVLTKQ